MRRQVLPYPAGPAVWKTDPEAARGGPHHRWPAARLQFRPRFRFGGVDPPGVAATMAHMRITLPPKCDGTVY